MRANCLIDFGACTCIWLWNLGTMDYLGDECHTSNDLNEFVSNMLEAFQNATDEGNFGECWDDEYDDDRNYEWTDLAVVATYTIHQQEEEEEYLRALGFSETKKTSKNKYSETTAKAWMVTVPDLRDNLKKLGFKV